MRTTSFLLSALGAALIATVTTSVRAAEAPYYNPANSASTTGKTLGHELNKTIGCPGRGILETPCKEPVAAKPPVVPAAPVDTDGDGVIDARDRCPGTVRGARVDGAGCEQDGDGDGIVDRLDQCPTTPAGRKVDARGCEPDSDADGVVDALDKCPGTPAGAKVDARGCELDRDGDGVVDRLDQCPTTPAGRKVDARGCEPDGDGDGVIDAMDQCPDTPAGDRVDAKGCSLPATIELKGVHFDNDQASLRPDALAILDETVAILKRYPGLKLEIAGHTDSASDDAHNLELSQRRAQAVLDHFVSRGANAANLAARGYGEAEPVADNASAEGRARNRRVELRVLN